MLKNLLQISRKIQKRWRVLLPIAAPILIVGTYVFSVCWRVSVAEFEQFGRSTLLPVSFTQRKYNEPAVPSSYMSNTYTYQRKDGTSVRVYKQLINGFQHSYGSALAAYEISNPLADLLFRANEYAESYVFCRDTDTEKYSLDTRKDLANNAVGRNIADSARKLNLSGPAAYDYILWQTVKAVDSKTVLPHFLDPRVASLPSESGMGCPGLRSERKR